MSPGANAESNNYLVLCLQNLFRFTVFKYSGSTHFERKVTREPFWVNCIQYIVGERAFLCFLPKSEDRMNFLAYRYATLLFSANRCSPFWITTSVLWGWAACIYCSVIFWQIATQFSTLYILTATGRATFLSWVPCKSKHGLSKSLLIYKVSVWGETTKLNNLAASTVPSLSSWNFGPPRALPAKDTNACTRSRGKWAVAAQVLGPLRNCHPQRKTGLHFNVLLPERISNKNTRRKIISCTRGKCVIYATFCFPWTFCT